MKKTTTKKVSKRAVVVTTVHRGVFFGYASKTSGKAVTLADARMCVFWSAGVKGVIGLAATGPSVGCCVTKATPEADVRGVTAVWLCTPEAEAAWKAAPWA